MRFVTFKEKDHIRAGVLISGEAGAPDLIIDGAHPHRPEALQALESTMIAWIHHGLECLSEELAVSSPHPSCMLALTEVRLLAPLTNPGKIVGAAFNYRDALLQAKRETPSEPVIFIKSATTIIGPEEEIKINSVNNVTYEAELAVIIGHRALKVSRKNAMSHVCGYVIFNDVSVTNYVKEDGCFVRGKNQRFTGPLGPWITSADDMVDPYNISMTLEVDGRRLQDSNTAQMLYRIDELIEYISARMPLEVGDIIATGTPAGVAATHNPPVWLTPGMSVSIQLDGLGELHNPVSELGH